MINILYKVLAYGYKSAVVRSNISALWTASAAASSRVKFRQRLNASEANFSKKKTKRFFLKICKCTMY